MSEMFSALSLRGASIARPCLWLALALCLPGLAVGGEDGMSARIDYSWPAQPLPAAAPDSADSGGVCAGLKDYQIVRAGGGSASCAPGNRVLGGSCPGGFADGEPNAAGTAWVCPAGRAVAICANVCSELAPPIGACCSEGDCAEQSAADCEAGGGEYQGDGASCELDSCAAMGACCVEEEEQCVETTASDCGARGGSYVGDDLACDSDEAAVCYGCPAGETDCGGDCVDLGSDPNNCGACGAVCRAGESCSGGSCVCPPGETRCDGVCTDTDSDPMNCGGCGIDCRGAPCRGGVCS